MPPLKSWIQAHWPAATQEKASQLQKSLRLLINACISSPPPPPRTAQMPEPGLQMEREVGGNSACVAVLFLHICPLLGPLCCNGLSLGLGKRIVSRAYFGTGENSHSNAMTV